MPADACIRREDLRRQVRAGKQPGWLNAPAPEPDLAAGLTVSVQQIADMFTPGRNPLPPGRSAVVCVTQNGRTQTAGPPYATRSIAQGQVTRLRNEGRFAYLFIAERSVDGSVLTVWTGKSSMLGEIDL